MTRTTPHVYHTNLVLMTGDSDETIPVGTSAWYAWLHGASTFFYECDTGSFTARKERTPRGSWYWKAYRRYQ